MLILILHAYNNNNNVNVADDIVEWPMRNISSYDGSGASLRLCGLIYVVKSVSTGGGAHMKWNPVRNTDTVDYLVKLCCKYVDDTGNGNNYNRCINLREYIYLLCDLFQMWADSNRSTVVCSRTV